MIGDVAVSSVAIAGRGARALSAMGSALSVVGLFHLGRASCLSKRHALPCEGERGGLELGNAQSAPSCEQSVKTARARGAE